MLALAVTSCQKTEDLAGNTGNQADVRIAVNLPAEMNAVRSLENPGIGDMVNRCIMEIYLDGELYGERQVAAVENKQTSFSARLVSGKTYKFVFWADCAEGTTADNFADKHYATDDLSNVSILDPAQYSGSNDERDAFFAVKEVEVSTATTVSAELRRPFGQLNVKTLDMNDVPESLRPTKVALTFDEVPTGINLLTGELTQQTAAVAYAESHELADASGNLSFDYVFAPQTAGEQRLVNFTMSFLDDAGTQVASDYEFTNIPVQRNYRTNVSGNLLTKKADITVTVDPVFGDEDIDHTITEAATIEELNKALAEGAENVVLTQAPTEDSQITIPHDYSIEDKEISISLPAVDKTITLVYDADHSGYAPEEINIKAEHVETLVIATEESTVNLDGDFGSVEASTADNTLVVTENTTVSALTLKKGSLKLYGVVESVSKDSAWTGTIYRCFNSQKSFDNLVADNVSGYSEILVEKATAEAVDGKNAKFTKQMTVSAPAEVNNFRIDVDYAGAYGLKIVTGATKVTMDNIVVTSTAKASRTVWIEAEKIDCSFSNSTFIVPTGSSNRSGINLVTTSPSCVKNVTLDNVLISIDETRLNVDLATDYQYSDELKNRVPSYSRGITIGHSDGLKAADVEGAVVNLTMKNSAIESLYYSINIAGTNAALNLDADNSVFDGRASFNAWGGSSLQQSILFRNSKLIGRNWFGGPTEEFATIVLNQDQTYNARNYNMVLDNCDVVSDNNPQTDTNRQYMASFRASYRNTLTMQNGTKFRETVNPRLDHAIDLDPDAWINEISWDDTFTISCAEGATVLVSNVWEGPSMRETALQAHDGVYYIGTPAQLADWVSRKLGNDAVLVRDMDLANLEWPVSTTSDAITGSFDGQGHTIYNLNCQTYLVESDGKDGLAWDNKAQNAALFPIFSGDIKNLTIDGATIYGSRSGALVGRFNGGTIDNCHLKNIEITGGAQKIGTLVGYAANFQNAVFSNCSVENATVSADKNAPAGDASCMAGGFIGYMQSNGVSVTVKNNTMTNVTVESGKKWDTQTECASHVFVGDVINLSETKKTTIVFDNNKLNGCKLLNAVTTSLTTEFFGFYYKNPVSSYPIANTIVVDGKTLVE